MTYKVLKQQNNSAHCFVCGLQNDASLKTRFYECENPDGEVVLLAIATPEQRHQSYPNRMHGGVISALLDETIGRAVQITHPDIWGVTVDLNVKYKKPTPLDQPLYIEAKITEIKTRGAFGTFAGEGKLFTADGTICATAEAKYFILPPDKIAEGGLTPDNWFLANEPLPDTIIIQKEV